MQDSQTDLLSEEIHQIANTRRKTLLPWWIKLFMWLFLVLGCIAPLVLIMGLFGFRGELAIYGLTTDDPLSITGITIILIFALKGLTSLGLLTEKDWAIKLGIADAIIGILFCVFSMIYFLIYPNQGVALRLELALLIPYLLKLIKIRAAWENAFQA